MSMIRNIEEFMSQSTRILDTSRKRSLWFYLLPILEEDHQDYAHMYLSPRKDSLNLKSKPIFCFHFVFVVVVFDSLFANEKDDFVQRNRRFSRSRSKTAAVESDSDESVWVEGTTHESKRYQRGN